MHHIILAPYRYQFRCVVYIDLGAGLWLNEGLAVLNESCVDSRLAGLNTVAIKVILIFIYTER